MACGLLGAAAALWAGLPVPPGRSYTVALLGGVLLAVGAGVARLGAGGHRREAPPANGPLVRAAAECLVLVGTAALEGLHPARPWHTGVLALLLTSYLWAVRVAEARPPRSQLRAEGPVVATGLGLAVVITGIAMLPSPGPGPLAAALSIVAAAATIVAGVLVLPHAPGPGERTADRVS